MEKQSLYYQLFANFLIFGFVILGTLLGYNSLPAGKEIKQGTLQFSGVNAYNLLRTIAQAPHELNSTENNRVREFIVNEVKKIQLAAKNKNLQVDISLQAGDNINNIVVKYQGKNSDALLISSHYDSVRSAYGATDDGSGNAISLELLRCLVDAEFKPEYSLIVLFNNGEEVGMKGSVLYTSNGPWFEHVKAFINFEGGGAGGQAMLFQANDYDMVKYHLNVPYPHCSAIGNDLFRLKALSSYTDYEQYKSNGLSGLDIAFYRNRGCYHTSKDDIENTSPGSLQQAGSNLISIVTSITNSNYLSKPRTENSNSYPLYYHIPGTSVVVMTRVTFNALNSTLLLLSFGLTFLVFYRQRKLMERSTKQSLLSQSLTVLGLRYGVTFSITLFLTATFGYLVPKSAMYGLGWLLLFVPLSVILFCHYCFPLLSEIRHQKVKAGDKSIDDKFHELALGYIFFWTFVHLASTCVGFAGFAFFYFSFWFLLFGWIAYGSFISIDALNVKMKEDSTFKSGKFFKILLHKFLHPCRYSMFIVTANLFPILVTLEAIMVLIGGLSGSLMEGTSTRVVMMATLIAIYVFLCFSGLSLMEIFTTKKIKFFASVFFGCMFLIFFIVGFAAFPYSRYAPVHIHVIMNTSLSDTKPIFSITGSLLSKMNLPADTFEAKNEGNVLNVSPKFPLYDSLKENAKLVSFDKSVANELKAVFKQSFEGQIEATCPFDISYKSDGVQTTTSFTANTKFQVIYGFSDVTATAKKGTETCKVKITINIGFTDIEKQLWENIPEWMAISSYGIKDRTSILEESF